MRDFFESDYQFSVVDPDDTVISRHSYYDDAVIRAASLNAGLKTPVYEVDYQLRPEVVEQIDRDWISPIAPMSEVYS